jgi:hypothetical protein
MPRKPLQALQPFKAFSGNARERKRAQYLLAFLQTGSQAKAERLSGSSCKMHERIIKLLIDTGDIYDRKSSPKPTKYTPQVMQRVYNVLTDKKAPRLTGRKLMKKSKEEGTLHQTAERKAFMKRLHATVRSKGHRLSTNSTENTFYITKKDEGDRMKYSHHLLNLLQQSPDVLSGLIFVDETTLEEAPHPKGKIKPVLIVELF